MAQIGIVRFVFRLLCRISRVSLRVFLWAAAIFGVLAVAVLVLVARFSSPQKADAQMVRRVREAATDGTLAYRLTEPNELIRLLHPPTGEMRSTFYDMTEVRLRWPGVSAVRYWRATAPRAEKRGRSAQIGPLLRP